ncbi:MAG TPA: hypothetical protein VMS74_09590 [Acidimicrobiia bacterium]|nr:hypothetical protein [Acidimicrobiia bacterium]
MATNEPAGLGTTPVEAVIARHTVRRAIWVGPLVVAVFWALRGFDGAWAGAVGVGVVVANFLLAGAMLSVALRISLAMYHAAALFGFFLRLGLIMGSMLAIAAVVSIDRLAFGLATVITYMVLLILESVAVARGRERDVDWTS